MEGGRKGGRGYHGCVVRLRVSTICHREAFNMEIKEWRGDTFKHSRYDTLFGDVLSFL